MARKFIYELNNLVTDNKLDILGTDNLVVSRNNTTPACRITLDDLFTSEYFINSSSSNFKDSSTAIGHILEGINDYSNLNLTSDFETLCQNIFNSQKWNDVLSSLPSSSTGGLTVNANIAYDLDDRSLGLGAKFWDLNDNANSPGYLGLFSQSIFEEGNDLRIASTNSFHSFGGNLILESPDSYPFGSMISKNATDEERAQEYSFGIKISDASSAILKAGAFGAKTFNDELEYLYIGGRPSSLGVDQSQYFHPNPLSTYEHDPERSFHNETIDYKSHDGNQFDGTRIGGPWVTFQGGEDSPLVGINCCSSGVGNSPFSPSSLLHIRQNDASSNEALLINAPHTNENGLRFKLSQYLTGNSTNGTWDEGQNHSSFEISTRKENVFLRAISGDIDNQVDFFVDPFNLEGRIGIGLDSANGQIVVDPESKISLGGRTTIQGDLKVEGKILNTTENESQVPEGSKIGSDFSSEGFDFNSVTYATSLNKQYFISSFLQNDFIGQAILTGDMIDDQGGFSDLYGLQIYEGNNGRNEGDKLAVVSRGLGNFTIIKNFTNDGSVTVTFDITLTTSSGTSVNANPSATWNANLPSEEERRLDFYTSAKQAIEGVTSPPQLSNMSVSIRGKDLHIFIGSEEILEDGATFSVTLTPSSGSFDASNFSQHTSMSNERNPWIGIQGFLGRANYYINKEDHDFIWEGITSEPNMGDNNLHPAYYINPMERINAHEFHVGAYEDTDGFHGRAIFRITESGMFGSHYLPELNSGGSLNLASTGNSKAPTSTDVDSPLGQLPGVYALDEKIKRPNSINFRYALYEGVNYPFVEMGQFFPGDFDDAYPVFDEQYISNEFTSDERSAGHHHILYSGRLSINGPRPEANLHITGVGAHKQMFLDSHEVGMDVGMRLYEGKVNSGDLNQNLKWHVYHEAAGQGSFNIKPHGANKNSIYIPWDTGNVGIGNFTSTNQPTQALHVAGDILYSGSITQGSDRKLKKNIGKLDKGLKELLKLNPVSFQQKTKEDFDSEESMLGLKSYLSKNDRSKVGLVAQEIEEIVPEVVHEDTNGIKSIDYTSLIPVLIKAVQEQNQEIIELKNLVNSSLL